MTCFDLVRRILIAIQIYRIPYYDITVIACNFHTTHNLTALFQMPSNRAVFMTFPVDLLLRTFRFRIVLRKLLILE
jgi:hypothetical protein